MEQVCHLVIAQVPRCVMQASLLIASRGRQVVLLSVREWEIQRGMGHTMQWDSWAYDVRYGMFLGACFVFCWFVLECIRLSVLYVRRPVSRSTWNRTNAQAVVVRLFVMLSFFFFPLRLLQYIHSESDELFLALRCGNRRLQGPLSRVRTGSFLVQVRCCGMDTAACA